KVVRSGSNASFTLSYGTLVEKARQLLAVLEFEGTPALYGPTGVENLALLQVGNRPNATCDTPDGARNGIELDAGSLDWKSYTGVAAGVTRFVVVVMRTTQGSYTANKEYWYCNPDVTDPGTSNFVITPNEGSGSPAGRLPSWATSPQVLQHSTA